MFSSDGYDPVYESIVINDDDNKSSSTTNTATNGASSHPAVKKRDKGLSGRKLLNQMHNLMSIYIPPKDDSEEGCVLIGSEHGPLLHSSLSQHNEKEEDDNATTTTTGTTTTTREYIFDKILDLRTIKFEIDEKIIINGQNIHSLTVVPSSQLIFFTLADDNDNYLYKINLNDSSTTETNETIIRGYRLNLQYKNNRFIPRYVMYNNLRHLFISGFIDLQDDDNEASNNAKSYFMVICDFDGNIVHRSVACDFERYGNLSGDLDGHIFILHPQLNSNTTTTTNNNNINNNNHQEDGNNSTHHHHQHSRVPAQSGVSKMKPNFSKKAYCLFFGNKNVDYRPQYIAGHCLNDMTWVSCERSSYSNDSSSTSSASSAVVVNRRLLGFNCCPPKDLPLNSSTKDWLKINSWSFGSLCPGPIAPLEDKLLVIDENERTLNYISWPTSTSSTSIGTVAAANHHQHHDDNELPKLTRITKPDPNKKLWGITTSDGFVYMWTDYLIYNFRFNTNLSVPCPLSVNPLLLSSQSQSNTVLHNIPEIC